MKVLFLIPNLGHGGAEKVLVNLVTHMDRKKYNVTVMALYDEGVNKASLPEDIRYIGCMKKSFPGVSHVLKLFSPERLYKHFIKEEYDIVVSYLEGQTARIVSGCKNSNTKKVCWIHKTMTTMEDAARLFRNKEEAINCYSSFDRIISVSNDVQKAFMRIFPLNDRGCVLYNTIQSDFIIEQSKKNNYAKGIFGEEFKVCAMGTLIPVKGFDRLIRVHYKLKKNGYPIHTYILGEGREKQNLIELIKKYELEDSISLLGYQKNPYQYMKQCDLFVCSSYSEGFSTAVTEALILGVPVVTTRVSGMTELLGVNNEFGIITDDGEEGLFNEIESLITNTEKQLSYKKQAELRGKTFTVGNTVHAVEEFLQAIRNE